MRDSVQVTNDADFAKDVLQNEQLALVDFWAEWCQPCKMISPIIDEVAKAYGGKLAVFTAQTQ